MKKSLLKLAVSSALALCSSFPAFASDWKTIESDHFNVHFTPEYQAWAENALAELEHVRIKLIEQQNRTLDKKVDVVVFDPFNRANGFVIPFSESPMMALFTTPPQSDTQISNSSGFIQLLAHHEYVHLVHLAQPTRNEWRQHFRKWIDSYDLTEAMMPRWVAEGYATLLESQMTGRGRLFDNYSEALIRQLAREGALPLYSQLSSVEGDYLAGAMAYLMGSRFFAWLEKNYSKQTLDAVWTRMNAVKNRDFDEAFVGAFGQPAEKLYKRFVAEYTFKALSEERVSDQNTHQLFAETPLWFDLEYAASAPALSPKKTQIALVERDKDRNTTLSIYSLEQDSQAIEAFEEAQQELLEDDPKDIADTRPEVFARKMQKSLQQLNYKGISNPRWLNDNTLIFGASSVANDELNSLHQDLMSWNTETGELNKLTQFANLRRFDISDDQQTLYAERALHGYSQLVKMDLSSGEVIELTPKDLSQVYDFPRLSPDNQKLAFLQTQYNQNWVLRIKDLHSDELTTVPVPVNYQFLSYPSWSADGESIYYVAGLEGSVRLYRYDFGSQQLHQLTNGQQVVSWPVPVEDKVLFLGTHSQGHDIFEIEVNSDEGKQLGKEILEFAQSPEIDLSHVSGVQLEPAKVHALVAEKGPIKETVGLGVEVLDYNPLKQKATFVSGLNYSSASNLNYQLGFKGNDYLNQLSWQLGAVVPVTNDTLEGFYAELSYDAHPVKFDLKLTESTLSPFEQSKAESLRVHNLPQSIEQQGVFLQLSYPNRIGELKIEPSLAYFYGESDSEHSRNGQHQRDESWWRVSVNQSWQYDRQKWAIGQRLNVSLFDGQFDTTTGHEQGSSDWQGHDVTVGVNAKLWNVPVYLDVSEIKREKAASLSLGGATNIVLNGNNQAMRVFSPELAYNSAIADKYQSAEFGLSYKAGAPMFYGKHHSLDSQAYANSYGIKLGAPLSIGLGSAALNDLLIDLGAAWVDFNDELTEDEARFWMSLDYRL